MFNVDLELEERMERSIQRWKVNKVVGTDATHV